MDEEATGQAQQQANVRVVASMLHFGEGGKDAVKMATLLGIPLSPDWGKTRFLASPGTMGRILRPWRCMPVM